MIRLPMRGSWLFPPLGILSGKSNTMLTLHASYLLWSHPSRTYFFPGPASCFLPKQYLVPSFPINTPISPSGPVPRQYFISLSLRCFNVYSVGGFNLSSTFLQGDTWTRTNCTRTTISSVNRSMVDMAMGSGRRSCNFSIKTMVNGTNEQWTMYIVILKISQARICSALFCL